MGQNAPSDKQASIATEKRVELLYSRSEQVSKGLPSEILLSVPGFIVVFEPDGTIAFANEDARRLVGKDITGTSIYNVLHPADVIEFQHLLRALHCKIGGRVLASIRVQAVTDEYRMIEGPVVTQRLGGDDKIIFSGTDVTRHKRQSRQYLSLLEGSGQGVIVHRGARPLFCNTAMAELVGLHSRQAVLASPSFSQFVHPDDIALVMDSVQAWLNGDEPPNDYQFRVISRNGEEVWVDCRSSVIEWDGEPAILSACFSINDRKRAEESQRQSERLFARVFHNSPNFISLSRLSDGVFLKVNTAFERTFGCRTDEVIGKSEFDFKLWQTPAARAAIVDKLYERRSSQETELRVTMKDSVVHDIHVTIDLILFEGIELLLIVGSDISERKRQEAELLASKDAADIANRAKSEFLANMSHELRTPLNAVLGFSEIIKNQIHGPIAEEKYVEYAGDIHASGSHLLDIINDILDLSKIEAGKLEVQESDVNFADVLSNCFRLIAPRAREAGVILRSVVSDDLPDIIADERLIRQILLNLLSNAVKFTPKGGEIVIRAARMPDGSFVFSVSDTGIGMDEEGIMRAMKPFGQVDSSLSRKHQGSGLGLPLVAAFAERQQATFTLVSAVGQGTTATVTFPADKVCPPPIVQ